MTMNVVPHSEDRDHTHTHKKQVSLEARNINAIFEVLRGLGDEAAHKYDRTQTMSLSGVEQVRQTLEPNSLVSPSSISILVSVLRE